MNEQNTSRPARKTLPDSTQGNATEVAGEVTGTDSPTSPRQLPQVQAQQRREANNAEAAAHTAEPTEEHAAVGERTAAAAEHRRAVRDANSAHAETDRVRRAADHLDGYGDLS